ncbi:N-acetylmuramoyl-L-alanine amidase [Sulfurimonas sp. NWX79]|uniref:N-acetylmuramoyl-L-alanine amidase family protein n=1 Tax=Sulfurimonas sp. NWX79 TaxID=2925412 RepID=UPI003204A60D
MLRSFVLLLVLLVSLYAQSDSELLKRANTYAKSSSKTDQFRAYNDYKNLYLRALMGDDEKLKKFALEGIVSSGTKLHIDVSQYARELLHMHSSYQAPKKQKKQTKHTSKTKKSKKIKVKSSHKLKAVRWKDGKLVLKFDKKLRNNQINYFTLYDSKKKKYKYIFDIHASMLTKSQTLRKNGIDRIKLAQYNPNTLRLVIANSKKLSIHFKKESTTLYIRMNKAKSQKTYKSVAKKGTKAVQSYYYKNKVIVIDAGHGGKDPGALGYRRYREKVVVLQIAQELKKILRSRGYRVYMTRDRDKFVKLRDRTKFANDKKADIFISIHANAVNRKIAKKAHGIECYFLSTSRSDRAKKAAAMENSADLEDMNFYGKQCLLNTINSHNIIAANKLAIDLQRGALSTLKKRYKNVKDAGVREGPFWVLVGAQMPAVLVEVGFITHPMEAKRLANRKYQRTMALGLANGIERYFINN